MNSIASNNGVKSVEDAVKEFLGGSLIAIAEYRSSRAEAIQWRDKDTQNIMHAVTLNHSIEIGNNTILLAERVPNDFKPQDYQSPFLKRQQVLVRIELVTRNKGMTTIYGKLEPLATPKTK